MYDLNSLLVKTGLVAASFVVFRLIERRFERAKRLPSPPGPKGILVGNLFQILSSHIWEKGVKWGKEYGRPYLLGGVMLGNLETIT